jgi:hypothetical protein
MEKAELIRYRIKWWWQDNIKWRFGKKPTVYLKNLTIYADFKVDRPLIIAQNTQVHLEGTTIKPLEDK